MVVQYFVYDAIVDILLMGQLLRAIVTIIVIEFEDLYGVVVTASEEQHMLFVKLDLVNLIFVNILQMLDLLISIRDYRLFFYL